MTTRIRLSGPADVLTVLPYQLGFYPHDCLVVVSLTGPRGSRVGLIERIDLPAKEHVGDAVAAMISPLRQNRPKAVLLVGFEEREGQSRAMLDKMAVACRAQGIEVADRLVVRGGRWFDLDCFQSCCPAGGLPLPAPSAVPAVSEYVGREIFPLADRLALANLLEPKRPQSQSVSRLAQEWVQLRAEAGDPGETVGGTGGVGLGSGGAGFCAGEAGLSGFRGNELAVWALVLCAEDDAQPIRGLPPQDLAMLAVSLTDVELRDGLIAWLCPGTLPQDAIDPALFVQLSSALPKLAWRRVNEGHLGHLGELRDLGQLGDLGDLGDLGELGELAQVIAQQRIERRLCELSAALPDAWAVSTLTVLASFTWWRGDGALTRIALSRALRVDPQYRLAQLLERIVDLAIRPGRASA